MAYDTTNYDANRAVAELEKLHYKGRKLADDFIDTFERNEGFFIEDNEFARLSVSPYVSSKARTISPHIQDKMDEFEQAVESKSVKWVNSVFDVLRRTAPQVRYRLQFHEAIETGYTPKSPFTLTSQGNLIVKAIDSLERHIKTLYKIIIDIDENTEKHIATKIQRASYDPVARTLYFAGKEIGFTKNAKYPPEICRLMFADLKKVDWKLSDFYELWQPDHAYGTPTFEDWQRIQDVIRKFNKRVENKTKISDLFIFHDKSVHLNRNYID